MNRILGALRDVIATIANVVMLPFRVVLRLLSPAHRRSRAGRRPHAS